jgi:hypothetical protein
VTIFRGIEQDLTQGGRRHFVRFDGKKNGSCHEEMETVFPQRVFMREPHNRRVVFVAVLLAMEASGKVEREKNLKDRVAGLGAHPLAIISS